MEILVWLLVAAVMAVVEMVSVSLITLWFVVGALASFVAALAGAPLVAQIVVFLVVSLVCLAALRPVILKYRAHGQAAEPTMIGKTAIVCEEVDNVRQTGRVRTADNMTWSARSASGYPIPLDASVRVVAQESIKLIVEPVSN